jgi:hypothetical protein
MDVIWQESSQKWRNIRTLNHENVLCHTFLEMQQFLV